MSFLKGHRIFEEGAKLDYIYLIVEGQVVLKSDDNPFTRIENDKAFGKSKNRKTGLGIANTHG